MRWLVGSSALTLACISAILGCRSAPGAVDPLATPSAPEVELALNPAEIYLSVPEHERWRSSRPKSGPAKKATPPVFKTVRLKNGLTLIVAEQPRWKLLDLALVTRGGAALDPQEKPGLGAMTYALIGEGEIDFPDGFMKKLGSIGASYQTWVTADAGYIHLGGASENKAVMFELLAAAATRPHFERESLAWRLGSARESRDLKDAPPESIAWRQLPGLIFGREHPYGHPPHDPGRMEISDLKAHRRQLVSPERSALIVAGAIRFEEATLFAKEHFEGWRSSGAPQLKVPAALASDRTQVVVIHRDNLSQVKVYVGRALPGIEAPERLSLQLLDDVLGGSVTSRLSAALREHKGYTYSAGSFVDLKPGASAFVALASIAVDRIGEGLMTLLKVIESMRSSPPSDQELQGAIDTRSVQPPFQTLSSVTRFASSLFASGVGLDDRDQVQRQLAEIDRDAVRALAQQIFDPLKMQIVLVGDSARIGRALKDLDLGPMLKIQD